MGKFDDRVIPGGATTQHTPPTVAIGDAVVPVSRNSASHTASPALRPCTRWVSTRRDMYLQIENAARRA